MARSTTFKYTVTVSNPGSGNRYYIDGNLQQYVTLFPGCTYEFNQDDATNAGHPLRFSETSDGTHGGGSEYTTGVTTSGTPGSATAWTKIEVTSDTPLRLYYYCSVHSGMGGNIDLVTTQTSAGNRFLTCGGGADSDPAVNEINIINMITQGNASDFGDLNTGKNQNPGSAANSIKFFVFGGNLGSAAGETNSIEFGIMAGTGTTTDWGDLQSTKQSLSGTSNSTRALCLGGYDAPARSDVIGYFEMASSGNASDFGNLTVGRSGPTGFASPTRAVAAGGYSSPGGAEDTIDYVTIASTGNATDFGDLTNTPFDPAQNSTASSVRGIIGGGSTPSNSNVIQYITIASTSNATDFGDLTVSRGQLTGGSNNVRVCFGGGLAPSASNVIDYIQITSTGNATDFGDLVTARGYNTGCSSNHGGLQ